jgi:uncharacterized Fe-S cluster-containing radical SAM superfamily protein
MVQIIDTDRFSDSLRQRSVDLKERRILLSNFRGTEQEKDLAEAANCDGFGRIRHFRRDTSPGWPSNPLPIDPASRALDIAPSTLLRAQVFQNAACNWRCWYCYVPFSLLAADKKHSAWLSAGDMIDLYSDEPDHPKVIDLSGGQPDLVPEWVPWMMQELRDRQMESETYLWSDDNLSNDYFWRFLTDRDRELIASYKNYGKVCCFKGFNAASFSFNTRAAPELFVRQLDLFRRFVALGIDVYAYATFTTPTTETIQDDMRRFVDSLQSVHVNLPLRVIPLEIRAFNPIVNRMSKIHESAMENQQWAISAWREELVSRFSASDQSRCIADVPIRT